MGSALCVAERRPFYGPQCGEAQMNCLESENHVLKVQVRTYDSAVNEIPEQLLQRRIDSLLNFDHVKTALYEGTFRPERLGQNDSVLPSSGTGAERSPRGLCPTVFG